MSFKVLLSKNKNQYKANLHCHSSRSDGKLSPEELKALYKANGYSILSITDHCNPKDHSEMNEDDFLLLTGYEAYIRPDPLGRHNVFAPEVHLNLFARDPKNETLICYNRGYTKYIPFEKHGELCRAGDERQREYTVEYINEFIQTAIDNGYLVDFKSAAPYEFELPLTQARYDMSPWATQGKSSAAPKLDGYPHFYQLAVQDAKGNIWGHLVGPEEKITAQTMHKVVMIVME